MLQRTFCNADGQDVEVLTSGFLLINQDFINDDDNTVNCTPEFVPGIGGF